MRSSAGLTSGWGGRVRITLRTCIASSVGDVEQRTRGGVKGSSMLNALGKGLSSASNQARARDIDMSRDAAVRP